MIKSMTGYGNGVAENENLEVIVEIKSLNSKFTDIYCRIPKVYNEFEIEIRNKLSNSLERGKIEYILTVNPKNEEAINFPLNKNVVKSYFKELIAISKELNFNPSETEIFRLAALLPNASENVVADNKTLSQDWTLIEKATDKAIEECNQFREQEGKATCALFEEYIQEIEKSLDQIKLLLPQRTENVKAKLKKGIEDLNKNDAIDQNRFEQEIIYYLEKYDISEEVNRLENHITYFSKELKTGQKGKKLNFISQELGREINTIGSKANDSEIQKLVVNMKDNLEKIKEQTLNIV